MRKHHIYFIMKVGLRLKWMVVAAFMMVHVPASVSTRTQHCSVVRVYSCGKEKFYLFLFFYILKLTVVFKLAVFTRRCFGTFSTFQAEISKSTSIVKLVAMLTKGSMELQREVSNRCYS